MWLFSQHDSSIIVDVVRKTEIRCAQNRLWEIYDVSLRGASDILGIRCKK